MTMWLLGTLALGLKQNLLTPIQSDAAGMSPSYGEILATAQLLAEADLVCDCN